MENLIKRIDEISTQEQEVIMGGASCSCKKCSCRNDDEKAKKDSLVSSTNSMAGF